MQPHELAAFLDHRLNYEQRGMPSSRHLRLDRMVRLLERLGRPDRNYPIVHIAGTKGKGSTATIIAQILQSQGLKVGLHTSPHFEDMVERFAINGRCPTPTELAATADAVVNAARAIDAELAEQQASLTYFEVTAALVFDWFARQHVDWGVIEVGMGGRLDATNVVQPAVSVITSIGLDHTKQLGNTEAAIAAEKAGIIKPGVPVVSGVQFGPAADAIAAVADEKESPLYQLGRDFTADYRPAGNLGGDATIRTFGRSWSTFRLPLVGEHQARNAALALQAVELLAPHLPHPLDDRVLPSLGHLRIPGRFEVVGHRPAIVLDVAHNPASITAFLTSLTQWRGPKADDRSQRLLIFATSKDKDWRTMLQRLRPHFDRVVLTSYQNSPRSESAAVLQEQMPTDAAVEVHAVPTAAWAAALRWAEQQPAASSPLIAVTGSFFLVAELRPLALSLR